MKQSSRTVFAYLKDLLHETIVTASIVQYDRLLYGNNKTVWSCPGLNQTLLIRLPFAYIMSIQPNASLTMIGLAAPVSTMVGIILNVGFFTWNPTESICHGADQYIAAKMGRDTGS